MLSHSGDAITTIEEWFEKAPPARGEKHWKDGRSAKELARRWLRGRLPAEIQELLESHPATAGFVADYAVPETRTHFDEFSGPRCHDLIVMGKAAGKKTI